MKRLSFLLLSLALLGISTKSAVRNVPYVIAFRPLNSISQPYVGQMFLNFNNGTISGHYTDVSVVPNAPLANVVNAAVSGGLSEDGNLMLVVRNVSFRGTMKDNWMSGNVTIRGRIYVFEAEQGKVAGF